MRGLRGLRRHLTFANVAAATALVVALSGTAYAAATITGDDVVNGSLTGADLKNGSVKSIDIGNHSILAVDLADGSVLSGSIADGTIEVGDLSVAAQGALEGPQGEPGADGAPGGDGVSGYQLVETWSVEDSTNDKQVYADCPAGKVAVGGGFRIDLEVGMDIVVYTNRPWNGGQAWIVQALENTPTSGSWRILAHAVCAAVTTP